MTLRGNAIYVRAVRQTIWMSWLWFPIQTHCSYRCSYCKTTKLKKLSFLLYICNHLNGSDHYTKGFRWNTDKFSIRKCSSQQFIWHLMGGWERFLSLLKSAESEICSFPITATKYIKGNIKFSVPNMHFEAWPAHFSRRYWDKQIDSFLK